MENFPDPNVPITPNKFEYMPYLKAVQKENFRKYPIVPGEIHIQKDAYIQTKNVFYNIWFTQYIKILLV